VNIVIAGASGYIGRSIIQRLLARFPQAQVTALSRSPAESLDSRVQAKACELFSLISIEKALPPKIDLAFYLVHSMGPTAQLDQGCFADYDLILADNFARALGGKGVRHLIYLGGLIPEKSKLSLHLQSRLEVEQTFLQYALPLTVFRAGLVLGMHGSSSQILLKLVSRLPVMLCPQWTQTKTTPVDLETVLCSLSDASLNESHIGKVYDLAGCRPISYVNMMRQTAQHLGLKRSFISVPFFTPTLSRLWVSLITNTSKALVYPLVESLEHEMIPRPDHLYSSHWKGLSYDEMIAKLALKNESGHTFFSFRPRRKTVRSVQRMPLPKGKNAEWVQKFYAAWLPQKLSPLIHVLVNQERIFFYLGRTRITLLELFLSRERSNEDRQVLYIVGGLLVSKFNTGRIEFRVVLNRQHVLVALHDFRPALPWFIYKYTQALVHLYVMSAFSRALAVEESPIGSN